MTERRPGETWSGGHFYAGPKDDDPPPPPARPEWKAPSRASRRARACPWRESCGCSKVRCHRPDNLGRLVPREECEGCAERLALRSLPAPDRPPGKSS